MLLSSVNFNLISSSSNNNNNDAIENQEPPDQPFHNVRALQSGEFYVVQKRRATDFEAPKL